MTLEVGEKRRKSEETSVITIEVKYAKKVKWKVRGRIRSTYITDEELQVWLGNSFMDSERQKVTICVVVFPLHAFILSP